MICVVIDRDASDDVGTMKKRPVRYATIDGAYTVYRVRLGAVDGTPQILYRYTYFTTLAEFEMPLYQIDYIFRRIG